MRIDKKANRSGWLFFLVNLSQLMVFISPGWSVVHIGYLPVRTCQLNVTYSAKGDEGLSIRYVRSAHSTGHWLVWATRTAALVMSVGRT